MDIGGADVNNKSIFKRYMACLMIVSTVFMMLMVYISYRNTGSYFTEEIYKLMESSQSNDENFLNNYDEDRNGPPSPNVPNKRENRPPDERRSVYKIVITDEDDTLNVKSSSMHIKKEYMALFIEEVSEKINSQKFGRGEILLGENTLLYSINKPVSSKDIYVITSMWASYPIEITKAMIGRTLALSIIFLIFLWTVSFIFNRYMSQKFKVLNDNLEALENRHWDQFEVMNETYETGQLNEKINQVRTQLEIYDLAQKEQFHAFSHELKTPIMIIKGYLDSIKNGLYPKGNLSSSLDVVYEETEQMEQLIKNVLYLNKLEYLTKHYVPSNKVDIVPLILKASDRFKILVPNLDWIFSLESKLVTGTEEQWQLIIDNLISNQIRYAVEKIIIDVNETTITIGNDGKKIEPELKDYLFEPFKKGADGKTGLGLSIVNRLLILNGYKIHIEQDDYVKFIIE